MKIFSKFNDYYDSAMAYGVDDHVHWVRKTTETELPLPTPHYTKTEIGPPADPFFDSPIYTEAPNNNHSWYRGDGHRTFPNYSLYFAGFCGKIYPYYEFWWYGPGSVKVVRTAFSADDIVSVLNEYDDSRKATEKFQTKTKNKGWNKGWFRTSFRYKEADNYFTKWSGTDSQFDMFVRFKTPIFTLTDYNRGRSITLTVNPVLKDIGFQRIVDPFTAYQEIEMFLSGILGMNDPETVDIEDKYMISQKGFDDMSFKKYPTKKRK